MSLQSRQTGGQIEQRTIAYFLEADRSVIWSGIECNGVYEMMLDQLEQVFQLQLEVDIPMKPEDNHEPELIAEPPSEARTLETEPELDMDAVAIAATEESPEPTASDEHPDESAEASSEAIFQLQDPAELELEEPSAIPTIGESSTESSIQTVPEAEAVTPPTLEITQITIWQFPEVEDSEVEDPKLNPSKLGAAKATELETTESETAEAEAMVVDIESRSLSNSLRKAEPFDLEVSFQLTGQGVVELNKNPSPYYLDFYVRDNKTGEVSSFGRSSVGSLKEKELTYTSRLKNAVFQKSGSYSIQMVTKLLGCPIKPIFFELPCVQVL